MQRMGLSHADFQAYLRALHVSHEVRYRVTLLNLNMQPLSSITPRVLSGQVLADRHSFGVPNGPQRRMTLSLLDPNHALHIDTDSPNDGVLYYDRLVQVHYSVRVPELARWVSVPVFTGRPSQLQRTDDVVDIEADDPSVTGLGAAWRPFTVPRGTEKVEAIRRILSNRVGTSRFSFPQHSARLHHHVSLHRHDSPWAVAQRIARSMDFHLYYTGDGVVALRDWHAGPVITFNTGPGGEITQPVAVSQTMDGFANVVEVVGRKPKGTKHRVRAVVTPPATHPLSPQRLGTNGVPYRVVQQVQDDHIRSHQEAVKRGQRILSDALRQQVDVSYSIIPMPHFDPGDMVRAVTTQGHHVIHRMDTWTLPIGVEGSPDMSVGWFDKPPVRPRRIRRR